MKAIRWIAACLIVTLLAGCANLGVNTFKKRLAAGYTASAVVADSTVVLVNAQKITKKEASNLLETNTNALVGLGVAEKMAGTDLSAANAKLTATIAVLTALQAHLAAKQGATQ